MNQPAIRELGAMKIVGVGGNFISVLSPDHTNMPVIPRLWDEYGKRRAEIAGGEPDASLGVVMGLPEEERSHPDEFHYIAGHEVASLDAVPDGMEGKEIPPATYAIFTHRGPIARIGEIYGYIYGEWLPTSEYGRATGPEFELYDGRFRHDAADSEMDIYIPIVPKEA